MDSKNIIYVIIGLFLLGAVLFKDTVSSFLRSHRTSENEPKASLERQSSSGTSPLSKVLTAIEGGTSRIVIPSKEGISMGQERTDINKTNDQSNQPNGDGIFPAKNRIEIDVSKISANNRKGSIRIRGTVWGRDIEAIEIYRNGALLQNVLKEPSKRDKMPFSFSYDYGLGLYKIRAVSRDGSELVRYYRFLPWIGGPTNSVPYATRRISPPPGPDWVPF